MQGIIAMVRPIFNLFQKLLPNFLMIFKNFKTLDAEKTATVEAGNRPITFIEQIQRVYKRYGAKWDSSCNIFGVQDEEGMKDDVFNDYIVGCFFNEKEQKWEVMSCLGTTNPSVYWTSKKNQRKMPGWVGKGAAHMKYGWHPNLYMIGKHKGYEALVQRGAKVDIWRDYNENFKDDDEEKIRELGVSNTGFFGLNLHHGGNAKKIGLHSAGCQVIQKILVFKEFMRRVKSTKKFKENRKNAAFGYLLVPITDLADELVIKIKQIAE